MTVFHYCPECGSVSRNGAGYIKHAKDCECAETRRLERALEGQRPGSRMREVIDGVLALTLVFISLWLFFHPGAARTLFAWLVRR